MPTVPAGDCRKSRRLGGEAAREVVGAPEELQEDAWRDPDDVSQMSQVEKRGWCDQLRDSVLSRPWFDELTEEQQRRVHAANSAEGGWLGEFTWFTAQFNMQGERPLSRANIKQCLEKVMLLWIASVVLPKGLANSTWRNTWVRRRLGSLGD